MQRIFGGLFIVTAFALCGNEFQKFSNARLSLLEYYRNKATEAVNNYTDFGMNIVFDFDEHKELSSIDKEKLMLLSSSVTDVRRFSEALSEYREYEDNIKKKNSALATNSVTLGILLGLVCFAVLY